MASQTAERVIRAIHELEQKHDCRLGVCFEDATLDLMICHREAELFHAASTMKVPVMIEVFRSADAGRLSLEDKVMLDPWCQSMIDGSPFECDARDYLSARMGQEVTVRELVYEMITSSDNLATNILIEKVTAKKITATMRDLDAIDGFVIRGLQDEPAFQAGISNRISARDLTILARAIDENRAASADACEEMRRILLDQKYFNMIPARLPKGVRVAHKTGTITKISHDTGIVYTPGGTYYVTILSEGIADGERAAGVVAEVSEALYLEREALLRAG